MELSKKIYKELKREFKNIRRETVVLEDSIIKGGYIDFGDKKVDVYPLSLGYRGSDNVAGGIIPLDYLNGDILLRMEDLRGKILYIKEIEKHIYLKYLFLIKPLAVITNSRFGRKIYSSGFPILNVYSFLNTVDFIEINLDIEEKKYKSQNIFIDFGIGGNFIIILFPFDSRYQKFDNLDFYGSFKLFYYLLKRFKNFNSNIYRIRFLAIDFKYSNYFPLYQHIKNLENVIAIYNVENSGLGNEKLIMKTYKYIIDKEHYRKILKIFHKNKKNLTPAVSSEFVKFPVDKPIVWFNSQPNINLYNLDKKFLTDKFILEVSQDIYEIIKNSYKEIGINA